MKYIKLFEQFINGTLEYKISEGKEKPGPDAYMTGLDKETEEDKEEAMKKQAEMDDDDPEAYKELPGDKEAREEGDVKTSKHVKSYHELYGDDEANESVNKSIITEKQLKGLDGIDSKTPLTKISDTQKLNIIQGTGNNISFKVPKGFNRNFWQVFSKGKIKKKKSLSGDIVYYLPGKFIDSPNFKSEKDLINGVDWESVEQTRRFNESLQLTEGTMSDIHQLAGDVKSEDEFVKRFFKEYGAKIKKTKDSEEWVASIYNDMNESIDEAKAWDKLNNIADDVYGEFGFASLGEYEMAKHIDLKKADKLASKIYGEFGFATLSEEEMEELINKNPKLVKESVINEEKAKGDRSPIDDEKIETALKNKKEETGVPMEFLRIIMRRGLAAWKTGHRPGATQQQWGYSRINSFLTKQPGTWGGADSDVAKEVRDGGHDKKLKKS